MTKRTKKHAMANRTDRVANRIARFMSVSGKTRNRAVTCIALTIGNVELLMDRSGTEIVLDTLRIFIHKIIVIAKSYGGDLIEIAGNYGRIVFIEEKTVNQAKQAVLAADMIWNELRSTRVNCVGDKMSFPLRVVVHTDDVVVAVMHTLSGKSYRVSGSAIDRVDQLLGGCHDGECVVSQTTIDLASESIASVRNKAVAENLSVIIGAFHVNSSGQYTRSYCDKC